MLNKLLIISGLVLFFSCGNDGRLFFKPSKLVIIATNDSVNNEVVGYRRNSDGKLDSIFSYSTQGKGINGPLRSQNSILWTKDGRFVLVCNAGSNDVSVFSVDHEQLTLVQKVSSMGVSPVSITQFENYVYVLNSGGNGTLSGFELSKDGQLTFMPGMAIEIDSVECGPAQASFTLDGTGIMVTCRKTNKIIGYGMNKDGIPISKTSISSNTEVPYGFDLDENGRMYVTEAKQSGLSVYEWRNGKDLIKLNDLTRDLHTAACWVKLTSNKKYAFVADADPKNIAGFRINSNGSVGLLKSDGKSGTTEHIPTELAIVGNEFLYVSNIRNSSIEVFKIDGSGNLNKIQTLPGRGNYSWGIVAN